MNKKILIAAPCYAGEAATDFMLSHITTALASSFEQPYKAKGIEFGFHFLYPESLIERARNRIANIFWRDEQWTHLMFIDADMSYELDDIVKLIDCVSCNPEDDPYDIIGGNYARKTIKWDQVKRAVELGVPTELLHRFACSPIGITEQMTVAELKEATINNQPIPATHVGTGCMLIRRNTIDKMREAYPELTYHSDHPDFPGAKMNEEIAGLFNTELIQHPPGTDYMRLMSEDYIFCERARRIGLRCWLHPRVYLKHFGQYCYETILSGITLQTTDGETDETECPSTESAGCP